MCHLYEIVKGGGIVPFLRRRSLPALLISSGKCIQILKTNIYRITLLQVLLNAPKVKALLVDVITCVHDFSFCFDYFILLGGLW